MRSDTDKAIRKFNPQKYKIHQIQVFQRQINAAFLSDSKAKKQFWRAAVEAGVELFRHLVEALRQAGVEMLEQRPGPRRTGPPARAAGRHSV